MDYDNFGTKLSSKRSPTFLPNRVNGISGKQLVAGTGFASDIEMESNAMFAFKNTFDEAEAIEGLRMGIDQFDNKPKFFIGDPTHFMKWDGTNATINGILYSTEGNIAGWIISNNQLYNTNIVLDSSGFIQVGDPSGKKILIDSTLESVAFYDSSSTLKGTAFYSDTLSKFIVSATNGADLRLLRSGGVGLELGSTDVTVFGNLVVTGTSSSTNYP